MAHPLRLRILDQLRIGEACVGDLRSRLGDPPQAYVSKQLRLLRGAGLVRARKSGQRVYYTITDPALLAVLDGARALALARPLPPLDPGRNLNGIP